MSQTPFTFVAMTYNLWGDNYLDLRTQALRALLAARAPDLLVVQELSATLRALIDEALAGHDRVDDEFPGWTTRGNIWWRRSLFDPLEYGAEDVGIRSRNARLFWARLHPIGRAASDSLVASTAHYTWQGHPQEREDELNPRTEQARRTVTELDRLTGRDGEESTGIAPCLFGVDANDFARPLWALREGGLVDSFSGLGSASPPTHPVVPNAAHVAPDAPPPGPARKTLDWLFHRGTIAPRTSEVVEFFHNGMAPSDHHPVVATYTLTG